MEGPDSSCGSAEMMRKDKVDSPNHTEYSLSRGAPTLIFIVDGANVSSFVMRSKIHWNLASLVLIIRPSSKWLQGRGRPRSNNLRDQPLTSMTSYKRNDELAHPLHARWFAAARVAVRTRSPPEAL